MRIILVCENFSLKMGGESQKSFHFLSRLLSHHVEVDVITHARVQEEVTALYADAPEILRRFSFVGDTRLQKLIWRFGSVLPPRIRDGFCQQLSNVLTMRGARRRIVELAAEGAQLVWQPIPISPKALCFVNGTGLPVVCGPMCGGLDFPEGFQFMDSTWTRIAMRAGRFLASVLHLIFRGKRTAAALIVSNNRTAKALPKGFRGRLYEGIPESGVDLSLWSSSRKVANRSGVSFLFVGRLVDWKGVQYLIQAFNRIPQDVDVTLHIVGDGPMRSELQQLAFDGPDGARIFFHGWRSSAETRSLVQSSDVFVMPSLRECGGNAILEAMASGLPLIVCNWAGPAQYVSEECAVLVDPIAPEPYIAGLHDAMEYMIKNPEERFRMGHSAQRRVRMHCFDWDSKTSRILSIFRDVLQDASETRHNKETS